MPDPRPHDFCMIAGGGTGGHVIPAVAVGQALVARGHDPASIHFVTSTQPIDR